MTAEVGRRRGMPPPASNDTGTALGQDGLDWSRYFATLTFDLGGHGACGWCGSSSSIHTPSLKFVGLAVRKIWCTMCVSINGPDLLTLKLVCESHQRWGTFIPNLGTLDRTHKQTDGRTNGPTKAKLTAPFPTGEGIISSRNIVCNNIKRHLTR